MSETLSRRSFFLAGMGAAALPGVTKLFAQKPPTPLLPLPPEPVIPVARRSAVSLLRGDDRRKLIYNALAEIDRELRPALKRKKYVVIKPNLTSVTNQLASTHADAVRGILDYLAPRFKGPVVIAEAASNDTMAGYENLKFVPLVSEFRSQKVSLVDLNLEGKYQLVPIIDYNVHVVPIRMAARLFDPDAFIINCCIPKTHNSVIFTAAVKNMVMGAPLRSPIKETPMWTDKRKLHAGSAQHHYNLYLGAQKLAPYWGATVLDGFEAMEGNGPTQGTMVPARIAMASLDYVAADRVAVEAMGMDAKWVGYLEYCCQMGLGNYDLAKIDVRGEKIAEVKRTFNLPESIDRQLQWMGPMGPDPATEQRQPRPKA
jgi:uncharacterized protein (DUF362 family)